MSSLRVSGDQVLVRLDEQIEQSDGAHGAAIHLAYDAQSYPTTGVVLAVGPGAVVRGRYYPTTLRKGQRVGLSFRAGQDMEINGARHCIAYEHSDKRKLDEEHAREGILYEIEEPAPDFESGADALEVNSDDGSGSVRA